MNPVVPNLNLEIKDKEFVVLVDTSGCGKSTTLRMIAELRDIVCIVKQNGWEIGFSCKHNHHAVKHSRLSDTIDFGKEWLENFRKVRKILYSYS